MAPHRRAASERTTAVRAGPARSSPVTAAYWHRRADGELQCDLCPHACRFEDGRRGRCGPRLRRGDEVVVTSYGHVVGACVDPIEKKPLHHVLPGTATLSFGTVGCNLACRCCQNWDLASPHAAVSGAAADVVGAADGTVVAARDVAIGEFASPDAIAATAVRLGCRSVAFTYTEPLVAHEFVVEVAAACRARGLLTLAVTAGYVSPAPRAAFFAAMDATNIDLKAFHPAFYRRQCGAELEPVLDTLRYVARETGVWLEVTTLLIPGYNDDDAELDALSGFIAEELGDEVPLHLTAFHPAHRLSHVATTPPATVRRARTIALANGLRYVYTGNVHDLEGGTTTCPSCGENVLVRDRYQIVRSHLDELGHCGACGASVPGRFDGPVGRWGPHRLPVSFAEADAPLG
jgi:pyruvate formate lyase activating enzyme